jgi:hypothetical protein
LAVGETHTYRATGHIRCCRDDFQAAWRTVADNGSGRFAGGEWTDISGRREEDGGRGQHRSQDYWRLSPFPG